MKIRKIASICLAAVLQVLPLTRVFVAATPATGSSFAIIATWIAGAAALFGGVDAVSGASTTITSPTTARATNGVAFSYRITTGPDVANTYAATPLPTGLTITTTSGRITGTPTVEGVFVILLTASDSGIASRTVKTNLTLTIVATSGGGAVAPSITTPPASQTVTAGGTATFTVVAGGTAPLSYQWRQNGVNVAGGTTSALTLTGVSAGQAGSYTVVVSNSVGSATSSAATLTVNAAPVAPSITTPPASQTVTAGGTATFTVVAGGTAPLNYQWRQNGVNVAGGTTSALTLTGVTAGQAGSYTVVVSNSVGSATSPAATLTVNAAPVAPSITTPPASQTVTAGGTATFTVVAGGTAPLSYQWRQNGVNVAGGTTSALTLTGVTAGQAGSYTVVVSNSVGSATSSAATLTVNAAPVAPSITTPPASQTVTAGGTATFTVVAGGTAPLSYQWRQNGVNVAGGTTSALTLTGVSAGQAGSYTVVVSNSVGSATSTAATLTVNKATATVTLGGLSATYDGTAKSVTATTAPSGLPVTITYNGGATAPVNAGSYAVVATVNHPNYSGSASGTLAIAKSNQTITFGVLPARAFGDAAFTLSATASSGLPVSFSSGNPGVATISGNTVTLVGAGSAVITASQAGNSNYTTAANVTQTLTVNKATATVTLSGLSVTYDGTAKRVTAATTPGGLPVTITYNGSATAPVNVGSYAVVATVNHANYSGSASGTLNIANPGASVTLTILQQGQGTVTPDLSGQSFPPGTSLTLTAQPNAGWTFSGWTVDDVAVSTNLDLALTLNVSTTVTAAFADASASVVAITSVSTNLGRATAPSVALSGTASGTAGVQAVEYALVNGGVASAFQPANGTTNWTIDLPSPPYGTNLIRVRARDLQGNLSAEAARTFVYVVLSPFTLSIAGSGTVTPNLRGQQLYLGRAYTLTAKANTGNVLVRWENLTSSVTSSNPVLSFVMTEGLALKLSFRETTRPLVTIASPVSATLQTPASAINFIGKASDASGLARVEYSLNGGDFKLAIGRESWYAHVNFQVGTNVFRVRSVDLVGNISAAATRTVFYSVRRPLSLLVSGQGAISGATNGQQLEIGRAYKLTAKPAGGQMFAQWSGGVESSSAALTFLMRSNLQLQANFVTNPFVPLKGTYQALFHESDAVRHDRSGALKLTVSSSGGYSASVKLGAKTVALAGQFNWLGQARLKVPITTGNAVAFDLQLDVTNAMEQITGVVTGTNWVAELSGYRAPVYSVTNPPLASGRFTFVIPADDRVTNHPAGLGYGTMTVAASGLGTLSGKLGDGTAFSVAATLSRPGYFPLYAQLYSAAGSALSWLQFTNQPLSDFDGALSWSKPPTSATTAYPAGFAVQSYCVGSTYTATNNPLLSLTNGVMAFSGGALGAGFTNAVTLQATGALVNLSTNKLSFTLTKSTGQFTGTVLNPLTGVSLPYGGVLFQKWNAALGQATASKQTSAVKLDAAD